MYENYKRLGFNKWFSSVKEFVRESCDSQKAKGISQENGAEYPKNQDDYRIRNSIIAHKHNIHIWHYIYRQKTAKLKWCIKGGSGQGISF